MSKVSLNIIKSDLVHHNMTNLHYAKKIMQKALVLGNKEIGFSSFLNNVIRAQEFILEGLSEGVEHCVALKCETGELLGQAIGKETSVKLCRVPKGVKYIAIHGHPLQKTKGGQYTPNFSREDFLALIENEDMMEIWIIDTEGNVNKIKKTLESSKFKKEDFTNYFNDELHSVEYSLGVPNFWQEFCNRFHFDYQEGFCSKFRVSDKINKLQNPNVHSHAG